MIVNRGVPGSWPLGWERRSIVGRHYLLIKLRERDRRVAEQAQLTHAIEGVRSEVARSLKLDRGDLIDSGGDLREDIARELHDQVVQTMYAMKVELENFRSSQYGREAVLREVDSLEKLTLEVLSNLRQLVRDLRDDPALQAGLISGLRNHLIPRFERLSGQTVDLQVSRSWPPRLNEQADINVYRIIQEALNNIWRHARGLSVAISLELIGPRAVVWVSDIGNLVTDSTTPRVHGNGVLGMRERAALLGGRLTMTAAPGGTMVRASFPLANLLP
jgi:signal transduction histidine kinase